MTTRADQRAALRFCPTASYTIPILDESGRVHDVLVCGHGSLHQTPACLAAIAGDRRRRHVVRAREFRLTCRRVAAELGIPARYADLWTSADLWMFTSQLNAFGPADQVRPTRRYLAGVRRDWPAELIHGSLDAVAEFTYAGALAVGRHWPVLVPAAFVLLFGIGGQLGWLSGWLMDVMFGW